PEGASPNLVLLDFDGFHHADAPPLPPEQLVRGKYGYLHRAFGMSSVITSDRPPLAALVYEIVCQEPDDPEGLNNNGRGLLGQPDLDKGSVVPPRGNDGNPALKVAQRWPEGWRLVERAFAVGRPEDAPSPDEWAEAILARARSI